MVFEHGRPEGSSLWERCASSITPDNVVELLELVADTPAPSGASSLTRAPRVREWCEKQGLLAAGARLDLDAHRSGCDVLSRGVDGLRMVAHLDEVSYLLRGAAASPGRWPLTPYCYHLAEMPAPARVVRFTPDGCWRIACHGDVRTEDGSHVFVTDDPSPLRPGDRVALTSDLAVHTATGQVTGSLDNAAGVVAALLAAQVLNDLEVPFSVVLTDEEEGPSGAASQTISRGASRIFRHLDAAPLTVAIDIHGLPQADQLAADLHRRPWGASLAEFSSGGRGSVAPPALFAAVAGLLTSLEPHGVRVRHNRGGYVPRSDDVVAMMHCNRVVILGYPGSNRHFDRGLPTANVHDLVDLATALVVLGVAVHEKTLAVDW